MSLQKPNVLIVDDDKAILHLMKNILKEFSFNPSIAASGEEALKSASVDTPDVMLVDLQMPVMDGRQLIAAIRQMEQLRDLRIIVLSGHALTKAEVADLGADASLMKPFDLPVLVEQVRAMSSRSHDQADRASETR